MGSGTEAAGALAAPGAAAVLRKVNCLYYIYIYICVCVSINKNKK